MSRGSQVAATSVHAPFERSVDCFLAAVADGAPVLCRPADAARTLAVAIAAEDALRTGRTTAVPA